MSNVKNNTNKIKKDVNGFLFVLCRHLFLTFLGVGADPNRPLCKKKKDIRLAKKKAKLENQNNCDKSDPPKCKNDEKLLEDLINAPLKENPAHRLEVKFYTSLTQN